MNEIFKPTTKVTKKDINQLIKGILDLLITNDLNSITKNKSYGACNFRKYVRSISEPHADSSARVEIINHSVPFPPITLGKKGHGWVNNYKRSTYKVIVSQKWLLNLIQTYKDNA